MTPPLILAAREADENESTVPSIGEHHPAVLALHSLNDAGQILRGPCLDIEDLDRVTELVAQSGHHLSALYLLLIRDEKVIEEQRLEIIGLTRANAHLERSDTENKERMAVAQRTKESFTLDLRYLADFANDLLERASSLDIARRTPAQIQPRGVV